MKLSIVIPVYDDVREAAAMAEAARQSAGPDLSTEVVVVDVQGTNLPAAKNMGVRAATGTYVLFLFPGIFPLSNSIALMASRLESGGANLAGVAGRWHNASDKLEIGYNVRRFPTLTALLLDILLLNKLFPKNRTTRAYKMHDFGHDEPIAVEHANDVVLMLKRASILEHSGFNEDYAPGWFDQVEFCQSLKKAGAIILYEPAACFKSNEKTPLISRLVRDDYAGYRRAECRYIRNHFGASSARLAQLVTAAGMILRLAFSLALPLKTRAWFLSRLRSYVDDGYVQDLRQAYWDVLKSSVRGRL